MSHSDKLKILLESKELNCCNAIKKLKKRSKIISYFSAGISISTIFILTLLASSVVLPTICISVLSIISATLTAIDCKFKLEFKSTEMFQHIEKLNKIRLKLEYINTCNGNLTDREYEDLFRDCNAF